jgi:uncharacterized protein with HEPN domain
VSSDLLRTRLRDILDNAGWIADDLAGISWAQFREDRRRADAVERCLQRITEAVVQLGADRLAEARLDVPWIELRNLGNRLRHEYRRIDRRVIFEIATIDVPTLAAAAQKALDD